MNIFRAGSLGVAATAALAAGLVTAGPAGAARSASPSASVANDTLTINGTNGDDAILLGLAAGDQNRLVVDLGNGTLEHVREAYWRTLQPTFYDRGQSGAPFTADERRTLDACLSTSVITMPGTRWFLPNEEQSRLAEVMIEALARTRQRPP